MADFSDVTSGAVGGAMAGTAIAPGIGTAIGAGVGLLGSLFGKSADQQRQESLSNTFNLINSLKAEVERRRMSEVNSGVRNLGRYGKSLVAGAGTGAAERMASMGRGGETASAILPAEQNAAATANQSMAGYVQGVNSQYNQEQNSLDNSMLGAQMQYNNAPISPSAGQTLLTLGGGISKYMQNRNYIDALKNYTADNSGTRVTEQPPRLG
jgi:hypothetical protein